MFVSLYRVLTLKPFQECLDKSLRFHGLELNGLAVDISTASLTWNVSHKHTLHE